jgi:hypothetical protein
MRIHHAKRQKPHANLDAFIKRENKKWAQLCEEFLPVVRDNSIWRFSDEPADNIPQQGWKLHVAATLLSANTVFGKVAPWLQRRGSLFKAPRSLSELQKINCGLYYGYSQVGKFMTIYPQSEKEAVFLAKKLHAFTSKLAAPSVPFDFRFKTDSCVHYRYGSFAQLNIQEPDGRLTPAIKDAAGQLVPDLRYSQENSLQGNDPFLCERPRRAKGTDDSPLKTTFRAFRSLTQRGKGGVYQALDFSTEPPRHCILKEGRRLGEVTWDGRDGRWLVEREQKILKSLGAAGVNVPAVYASFEVHGNYYLALEYVEGESLLSALLKRRRRLAITQALRLTLQIAKLLDQIHSAGWAWRDLKPANILVSRDGRLRPLDFEGASRVGDTERLIWSTPEFTFPGQSGKRRSLGEFDDCYALGAILWFLLTGQLRNHEASVPLRKARPGVPKGVCLLVEELLHSNPRRRPNAREIQERVSRFLPGNRSQSTGIHPKIETTH